MPEQSTPAPSTRVPLALALKYEHGHAPRLVAKGRGSMAESILRIARQSGVAIEEDPILAEALASVELDREIPPAVFQVVAEIIAFALSARLSPIK
jgi:flagellar biosynthesis protein